MDPEPVHPETLAAQALGWIDEHTRAITPPIHVSSTYLRDPDNRYRSGRIYARADNPAFDQAEAVLCALEGGAQALLFASGMAAATAVFQALAPGDHVLAPKVMYWSLRNWLTSFAVRWGLQVELIDMHDPAVVQAAVRPGQTALVWIETPANPLWTVTDIAATAQVAHAAGALLAVDSTVATPVLTRPLALGADIVMHAATKYLNGHSDLIAGALVVRQDGEVWQRVRKVRAQVGGTLGSFESWLLLRGMRTLHLRVRAACASAQRIAEHIAGNDHVKTLGRLDQLHGSVVHVHVVQRHVWVLEAHLSHHVFPELEGFQHVGLVDTGHALAALAGRLEGDVGDALDLGAAVAHGVIRFLGTGEVAVGGDAPATGLAKVNVTGQLADDQDVQPSNQLGLEA